MKNKVQKEVLSQKANLFRVCKCAPPGNNHLTNSRCRNGSLSLCALRNGSLTVEASLVVPFFLTVFLAFISFFLQYASAADLKLQAAAEAKKVGIVWGTAADSPQGNIVIYKSGNSKMLWELPFVTEMKIEEKAVCRAWIGFTELETEEIYVYITPEGSVYHLYRDCTHLNLSIELVSFEKARSSKNQYGESYRECKVCDAPYGFMVYITREGNCYHSERNCSGLKRTVRQVPMSEVEGRNGCIRCISREE